MRSFDQKSFRNGAQCYLNIKNVIKKLNYYLV
jgi:hypothetical protein